MTEPRPETDDYDLLTFGEVAARISEELAEVTGELERVRTDSPQDTDTIRRLEERIALLQDSANRYRQEEQMSDAFHRRFGPVPKPPSDAGPEWR